jgi:hypothetical protein
MRNRHANPCRHVPLFRPVGTRCRRHHRAIYPDVAGLRAPPDDRNRIPSAPSSPADWRPSDRADSPTTTNSSASPAQKAVPGTAPKVYGSPHDPAPHSVRIPAAAPMCSRSSPAVASARCPPATRPRARHSAIRPARQSRLRAVKDLSVRHPPSPSNTTGHLQRSCPPHSPDTSPVARPANSRS